MILGLHVIKFSCKSCFFLYIFVYFSFIIFKHPGLFFIFFFHSDLSFADIPKRSIEIVDNATEAAKDSHAIVICTEWSEFQELDYRDLYSVMRKPAFVFDGRNLVDASDLTEIGFRVEKKEQKSSASVF